MKQQIEEVLEEIKEFEILGLEKAEEFRIKYLSSKGLIKQLFTQLRDVPNEQKREVGQLLNGLREQAQNKYDTEKANAEFSEDADDGMDLSRPGDKIAV